MKRRRLRVVFGAALAIAAILPAAQPALAQQTWTTTATAAQVVPGPGLGDAIADLSLNLVPADGLACVGTHLSGFELDVDPITAIAVHEGAAGIDGPVAFDLAVPDPPDDNGICTEGLDPGVVAAVAAHPGDYYVEVDTVAFPGGAVRGQLEEHDTVEIWVVEVLCPPSVKLPKGSDLSILFSDCQMVGRPGDFPTLETGFTWRLAPVEIASLDFAVRSGDGSISGVADGAVYQGGYCDGTAHVCEAVLLYDWQELATGSMSVTEETTRSKAKFVTAFVLDGDGNLRDAVVNKKQRQVRFNTTGADNQIYVYIVDRQ